MATTPEPARRLSRLDQLLAQADQALRSSLARPSSSRPSPAADLPIPILGPEERRHVAGLMRINHVGEVCAQALYYGQACWARDEATRQHLLDAADEEAEHLAWCAERLDELGSRASLLNPLWYAGAWSLGASAGLLGDRRSLGFVVETERQVEAHLSEHLEQLPATDTRSRAILLQMREEESRHAENAEQAGGRRPPWPIPRLMQAAATLMRTLAYLI